MRRLSTTARILLTCLAVVLLPPATGTATTFVRMDEGELVRSADVIVIGTVSRIEAAHGLAPDQRIGAVLRPDDRVVQGLEDVRRHFVVLLALCEGPESRMMPCRTVMKYVPYRIVFKTQPLP